MAKDNFNARVAELDIELGMSVQNASGIWCKPTVRMSIAIDGGTNPEQEGLLSNRLLMRYVRISKK